MEAPRKVRELTPAALIGGVLVGTLLNMGIVFAGLQIGFTIVGSTVAAVLGFGLLRGILRKGSILEVNIFQTVASSVNTVNAGIIFTVPVLFLLGMEDQIDPVSLLLAAVGGSLLGVVMIIPLRKQIIDYERLRFPEGTAVAAILRSPGEGVKKARLLLIGFVASGTLTLLVHLGAVPETLDIGSALGIPSAFKLSLAVGLLTVGAGFLAGRGGLVVLYGTLLNYWVLIPACVLLGWLPWEQLAEKGVLVEGLDGIRYEDPDRVGDAAATFGGLFAHYTSRHIGIGMILGGAIAGVVLAAPALKSAIASLKAGSADGDREEVPLQVINIGSVVGLTMLLVATKMAGGDAVSWGSALLATLAGAIWLWLAGLVVAQTTGRTDWSPLSGLALIAIAIMMGGARHQRRCDSAGGHGGRGDLRRHLNVCRHDGRPQDRLSGR